MRRERLLRRERKPNMARKKVLYIGQEEETWRYPSDSFQERYEDLHHPLPPRGDIDAEHDGGADAADDRGSQRMSQRRS